MKRLRILSVFMVLFTILGGMMSCETEPVDPLLLADDGGDTIVNPGVFTVKIGSILFVADRTEATLGNGVITITGYKGDQGENVKLTVPATTTGTYTISLMEYFPGTSANHYTNVSRSGLPSGSVTITNINTANRTIAGRFNFTGYYTDASQNLPQIAFTEGVFTSISYGGGTTPTGPASFKASVDGTAFTAAVTTAVLGSGLLTIQGVDASGKSIIINAERTTPGTYTDVQFAYSADVLSDESYNNLVNDSGTLTITSVDTVNHTITGTFSFTGDYSDTAAGLPAKRITNGVFTNVSYVGSVDSTDVFNATVNGTPVTYGGSDLIVVFVDVNEFSAVKLRGTNANHAIELVINENTRVGSYAFTDALGALPQATFKDANGLNHNITRGSLVITANDGIRIKGTFEFDVLDGTTVTNTVTAGAFDIEL